MRTLALLLLAALTAPDVEKVVRKHTGAIRACYERELLRKPSLRGRITVEFTIARDGTVPKARVKSSTVNDSAVEACVVDRFKQMRFPWSDSESVVRMPIDFSPDLLRPVVKE